MGEEACAFNSHKHILRQQIDSGPGREGVAYAAHVKLLSTHREMSRDAAVMCLWSACSGVSKLITCERQQCVCMRLYSYYNVMEFILAIYNIWTVFVYTLVLVCLGGCMLRGEGALVCDVCVLMRTSKVLARDSSKWSDHFFCLHGHVSLLNQCSSAAGSD